MSEPEQSEPPKDPDPDSGSDWVERLAGIAAALGVNRVKARWKLQRMQNRWRKWRRQVGQRAEHVRYAHKTCPSCSAVQDKGEKLCTVCGQRLGARRWQVLKRLGIESPVIASMSTLLGVSFVVIYGLMILQHGGGIMSLPGPLLYEWGANFVPATDIGEYWRWATACFLHAGLWHLGFNLIALAIIGQSVEQLYGRFQLLFVFLLTGVIANIGSGAMGLYGVGIGASGGLMGLVGLVAGWGHRDGTGRGREARNQMLKWAAYVVVFGFIIGADNWAHGFGFVSGALLGFAVRPTWFGRPALRPLRWLTSLIGIAGCVGVVAMIVTGVPSDNQFSRSDAEAAQHEQKQRIESIKSVCAQADHSRDRAVVTLGKLLGEEATPAQLDEICAALSAHQQRCETAKRDGAAEATGPDCKALLD